MKLTHRVIECRTKRAFKISQSAHDAFRMVICELRHGELVGYGESSPSKRVTGETIDSVGAFLDAAADEIADVPLGRWEAYLDAVHARGGQPSARAALDLALHDLVGKVQDVPVRSLYGLPSARLETCMTVSLDEPKVMADEARGYHEAGFDVLKLKLGKPDRDVERVDAVRAALDAPVVASAPRSAAAAPRARLRADANTGWSPLDSEELAEALAARGVEFLEQPFPPGQDAELAALSRRSPLTLYADESVMDVADVRRLHALGFRGGVNLKLQKTGGIRPAVAAIREARALGYRIQLGCNVETAVGIAAGVQLLGALDHADLDGHLLLADAPFVGPVPERGWYATPDAPGLGVRQA